jgi:Kef-type K+ transport system membrane component KefB
MSYGILFLIVACGVCGSLIAGLRVIAVPVILAEIAAGVIIGKTGLDLLPTRDPTQVFLSLVGLALLQFIVGTKMPLSDPCMRKELKFGVLGTVLAFALATPLGILFARYTGFGNWMMFSVLFAASSSAIAMPIILERRLEGPKVTRTVAWVVVADFVTVIALALAMSTGENAASAVIGSALVIAVAVPAFFFLKWYRNQDRLRTQSKERGWALDLRVSLLVLLGLCWLAQSFGASILIAGFAAGAVISMLDMPKRFKKQLVGLGEGFFIPLFFVDLGAQLDFRAFATDRTIVELTFALWLASVVVHLAVALMLRLPLGAGMMASAQKGVSAAVVSLGLASGVLTAGQGAAIISAMMLALVTCSFGAGRMARLYGQKPGAGTEPKAAAEPGAETGPAQVHKFLPPELPDDIGDDDL